MCLELKYFDINSVNGFTLNVNHLFLDIFPTTCYARETLF